MQTGATDDMENDPKLVNYNAAAALAVFCGWMMLIAGMAMLLGWGGALIAAALPLLFWGIWTGISIAEIRALRKL